MARWTCVAALLLWACGDGGEAAPVAPAARWGHAMVYDAARDRVLLFGGSTGTTFHDDTWSWDGSRWTQLAPSLSPPARDQHVMAYDGARGRVVLFGGRLAGSTSATD